MRVCVCDGPIGPVRRLGADAHNWTVAATIVRK
jgi:hypothetical protein